MALASNIDFWGAVPGPAHLASCHPPAAPRGRLALACIGLILAATELTVAPLKRVVQRPRPDQVLAGVRKVDLDRHARPRLLALTKPLDVRFSPAPVPPGAAAGAGPVDPRANRSFPSGHVMDNFAVATVLALLFRRRGWWYLPVATAGGVFTRLHGRALAERRAVVRAVGERGGVVRGGVGGGGVGAGGAALVAGPCGVSGRSCSGNVRQSPCPSPPGSRSSRRPWFEASSSPAGARRFYVGVAPGGIGTHLRVHRRGDPALTGWPRLVPVVLRLMISTVRFFPVLLFLLVLTALRLAFRGATGAVAGRGVLPDVERAAGLGVLLQGAGCGAGDPGGNGAVRGERIRRAMPRAGAGVGNEPAAVGAGAADVRRGRGGVDGPGVEPDAPVHGGEPADDH